ncbi:TetR family transcriptional regulator [Streptomyces sp. NPDC049954]|uniref:TetR family transcriptional regulator n=1 Tax=Streptomyces sp. NPDC049954 TaxID=3155779 RepID=UPI00341D8E9B
MSGLRERKRQRTYRAVSDTAVALFLDRGFDAVSVAEVAAAADISKPTLFRYFPAKEDLVLHRFADHEDEAARVVRASLDGDGRRAGDGRGAGDGQGGGGGVPVAVRALHAHFRAGLDRRDPVTGLNDSAEVLAFHRLLYDTPSLVARLHAYTHRSERALALALDGVTAGHGPDAEGGADPSLRARLAAAQIVAVQRVLAEANWRRMAAGETADAVYPEAVREAADGFAGLGASTGPQG